MLALNGRLGVRFPGSASPVVQFDGTNTTMNPTVQVPHNSDERVPVDRSRTFDPADYPHQPHKYRRTDHFRQRFKDPERFLTNEVIQRTIVEGELKNNGDGCASFHWMRHNDGVEWWFIAGHHHDGYLIAVTAWPYLRDREQAAEYGWSAEDLDTIREFNVKNRNNFAKEWSEYVDWSMNHNGAIA